MQMAKYLSIYLLLKLGGKDEPTKDDVSKVLKDVGIEVDR
jgi:ribosomal protein L12E/L44/L45/RPP1/RPP2